VLAQPEQRVPDGLIDEDGGSLRLIELDEMVLHAGPKAPDFGDMKPIVQPVSITVGSTTNWTSPIQSMSAHAWKRAGEYRIPSVVACISLSEPHTNQNGETFAYKLVASIITSPERERADERT
jgi:hypothetical protein